MRVEARHEPQWKIVRANAITVLACADASRDRLADRACSDDHHDALLQR
jgi:hypothetical protein